MADHGQVVRDVENTLIFAGKLIIQGYKKGNFDVINAWMYNFEGTINA